MRTSQSATVRPQFFFPALLSHSTSSLTTVLAMTVLAGRFFAGKTVTATLHDGKLRYKRSGGGGGDPDLDDDEREKEEERRLEKYREFLEKDA